MEVKARRGLRGGGRRVIASAPDVKLFYVRRKLRPRIPLGLPADLEALLVRLLGENPQDRPTMRAVLTRLELAFPLVVQHYARSHHLSPHLTRFDCWIAFTRSRVSTLNHLLLGKQSCLLH